MQIYFFQLLNGIGLGMIYFLMSVGLSILFGLMNFVNFAHGAFYLLGAYICYEIVSRTGSFYLSMLVAPLCIAALGWILNKSLLNKVMALSHSAHILITFGIMLIIQEAVVFIWGPLPQNVPVPAELAGVFIVGNFVYPQYRLFIIVFTAIVAVLLYLLLEKTKFGSLLRASSQEAPMVSLLGVNVARIFSGGFALGGLLAGLGGVMAAPLRGVDPAMGFDALAIAFAVVIVGGLGSFTGALFGGLLVGIVQSLMSTVWPEGARLMIYCAVGAVLLLKPNGLLGKS
ncbi:branched-chain amino acid ABC transporter permease [Pollutimonas thiosulfatoxidans]|uniref:Branched-chain amino acid ABC transporter permease n=1 Tax=Pollutimonas thiosulfatoxidans TaxID=2028345 RepID=A0A410GEL7_9BURK|nr:branched-chain amino acid ABC transporter permease [Pollutimonas thiosulfatoxidans]QAA94747.1 branched-chain amino acid ABC transporter permease [Pollutimonas thiosulfatoxidans]